jgi:hypothetical protein
MDQVKLAKGLGWMGIGLGLIEMLAPEWLARQIGVDEDRTALLRAMGAREVVIGGVVLMENRPITGMWGRVAGDAVDISLLVAALMSPRSRKGRVLGALGIVLGATLQDVLCARGLQTQKPEPADTEPADTDGLRAGQAARI